MIAPVIISGAIALVCFGTGAVLRLTEDFREYSDDYIALIANDGNTTVLESD